MTDEKTNRSMSFSNSQNANPASGSEREFTVSEGLAYMLGAIGIQLLTTMIATWSAFFYHPPKGSGDVVYVGLGLATSIMMIGVFFDAVSDPLVGYWSDRTRSRLGRRRPFIIYGSLPTAIVFILLWYPPVQHNHWVNFAWGTFFAIAFFWGITIVMVPYIALLPEMARTTQGRVKLGTYQAVGMIVGLVLGFMSGVLIEAVGFRTTAIVFGAVAFVCFQVTGWLIRERYKPRGEQPVSSLFEMISQLSSTLKNRPFLIFITAETIFTLGIYVIHVALPDYSIVILKKGKDFVTYLFIPFLLVCFPLIFLVGPSVKKWKKKSTYAAGIFGFAILFPFLGVVGLIPDISIDFLDFSVSLKIVLLLIVVGLAGAPQAIKYVMPGVFIGEIADYDEQFTGQRREAIYSGTLGFAMKMAMMLSYFIRWAVYTPFGEFSVDNPTPVLLLGPVTAVICFVGFLAFLKYPVLHVVRGEKNNLLQKRRSYSQ